MKKYLIILSCLLLFIIMGDIYLKSIDLHWTQTWNDSL